MHIRTLACSLAFCAAAAAPPVLAQQPNSPFFQASPESAPLPSPVAIGRGRVDFQNRAQQRLVYQVMPRIQEAVSVNLANPDTAELSGLRTGRYRNALVVCGVVESLDRAGARQKARFIARPSIATLETQSNGDAFQAGWKDTGCGF